MDKCWKVGIGFGLASGVITTLGLMVGLYASTNSRPVVLGGILTIAIADALSDAFGIHLSEESEGVHTEKEIWASTIITFLSKLIVALSFLVAILLLPLKAGILTNIGYSFLIIGIYSYIVAKKQKNSAIKAIFEHFSIVALVTIVTFFLGKGIDLIFIP